MLISAGFDALADDPSADTRLEVDDFAAMACLLRDLGAPVGAVLEGGYGPSLAAAVAATTAALDGAGDADWVAADPIYTRRVASFIGHYWQL